MALNLKILSGPLAGRSFPLRLGLVIGRAESDITLSDPKISGRHAKIENDIDGNLILTDLGSTNGMRVDGQRQMQIVLTPGLIVKIGNTDCAVEGPAITPPKVPARSADNKTKSEPLPPIPSQAPDEEIAAPPPAWADFFSDFCERSSSKVKSRPQRLWPFKPLLKLTAIQGHHIGQEWPLGYGPRTVGAQSLDVNIFDSEGPDATFTVTPDGAHARFETNSPDKVRLNGSPKKAEILKDGDLIQFENTVLRVSFIE